MRKILFTFFCFLCIGTIMWGKEFNENAATALAGDFLRKLRNDTPFTYDDEKKYFGVLTAYSVNLMLELGYIDQKGAWRKAKPRFSYLGELIRMNSALLLIEKPSVEYLFAGLPKDILKDGSLGERFFMAEVVFVQYQKSLPAGYGGEVKIVNFFFAIPRGKLDFPIFVNGKSFAEQIGFEFPQENGAPVLNEKVKTKLLMHIQELEKTQ